MALILRTTNGAPLTWEQGDQNLIYLYSGSLYNPYSGSVTVTGSIHVSGSVTATSFVGTASYAILATTASYYSGSISNALSSSYAVSSSYTKNAATASYALNAISTTNYINVLGSSIYSSGSTVNTSNFSTTNGIFLGVNAGFGATTAYSSNFIGAGAGLGATNAHQSNFIGVEAGKNAVGASNSTFLGYQAGSATTNPGVGDNNIIIGTNITLPDGYQNGINIGGLIYGSGSYSNTATEPYSAAANGFVGINQPNPQYNLDVAGTGNVSGNLAVSGSLKLNAQVRPNSPTPGTIYFDSLNLNFYGWNGSVWVQLNN
jgi:hypothetical protein